MNVAVFSARKTDQAFLTHANEKHNHELRFFEASLNADTAPLAEGSKAVCAFVNDILNRDVLAALHKLGVKLIALRCGGFNNVDVPAADDLDLTVVRVPAYSPYAVAEHTVGLMLVLNRKLHRAVQRVREQNFSLDGLLGFDMHEKTVGIIGTGRIGTRVAHILRGFGCKLVAFDPVVSDECVSLGVEYLALEDLASASDVITLHCPLTPQTHQLIDADFLRHVKPHVMLINTNRGAVIDTRAVIEALKNKRIGSLGLDVYEEEADLFFRDLSDQIIQDDVFARLMTFPNVIVTAHQAFFTKEAVSNIASTTLQNITDFTNDCVDQLNQVTEKHFK